MTNTATFLVKIGKKGEVIGDLIPYKGERKLDEVFLPDYLQGIPLDKLQYTPLYWKVLS